MTRVFRSRRLALVAAATVTLSFVAGACGSEPRSSSVAPAASPTTVATSPQVIVVGGSSAGAASAVPAASPEAAADSKMIAALITYSYSGDVPDLTGDAPSWYYPAGVAPTEAQIADVAAALGLAGDVVALTEDQGGGWRIGPADYSGPAVTVGTDALQSWWYNGEIEPLAEPCAYYPPGDPAADSSSAAEPPCDEVDPPENVLDEAAARTAAVELFTALGMDMASYELEVYADEWSAGATAYLVLDGMRTTVAATVGFGSEGKVTWANGFLAEPVRGGDYPRIGVQPVIDRLNEQSASWYRGTDVILTDSGEATDVAAQTGVAAEPAVDEPAAPAPDAPDAPGVSLPADPRTSDTAVAAPVPADSVLVEPMPGEPMPVETGPVDEIMPVEPEPIEVTLTGATASLEQIWALDGTVWLLPGYRFTTSDGGEISAPAVSDEYLQYEPVEPLPVDQPAPEDIIPTDSVPTGPATVDTGTGVDGGPTAGGSDPVACAGLPSSMPAPVLDESIADIIVGMCLDEATSLVEGIQPGAALRVVREDGVDLAITMDFSESRVNVATEAGVITEVVSIG